MNASEYTERAMQIQQVFAYQCRDRIDMLGRTLRDCKQHRVSLNDTCDERHVMNEAWELAQHLEELFGRDAPSWLVTGCLDVMYAYLAGARLSELSPKESSPM